MEKSSKISLYRSLIVTFAVFLIAYVALFFAIKTIIFQIYKNEVSWATDVALAATNPKEAAAASALLGNNFVEDATVKRLKSEFEGLGNLFLSKGIDAVYLMDKRGNDVYFLVESTPFGQTGYVVPGSLYREAPDALKGVFSSQQPVFTGLYTDEYGTYFSEFAPLMDGSLMVGAIGVDIDNSYFTGILLKNRLIALAVFFLLYLVIAWNTFIRWKKDRLEAAAHDSDAKIKSIIDAIPSGIIAYDKDEKIEFWNHACDHLFGLHSKEVLGKNIGEVVSFEGAMDRTAGKRIDDFSFSAAEEYRNKKIEISVSSLDGKKVAIEASFSLFGTDDEKMFIGLFEDISERKEREKEMEEQRARLEKMNGLMIDRELKMLELKNELARIKGGEK